jgi:hypothetical protein
MSSKEGLPVLKPWRIVTTSYQLARDLNQCRCTHGKGFKHSQLEGSETSSSAFYPSSMCTAALTALFPWAAETKPAMPTVPIPPEPSYVDSQGHFDKGLRCDSVAPSLDPVGLVFETDPGAPGFKGPPTSKMDLEAFDLEIDAGEDAQVLAAVTRLLSRSETLSNPRAREAVKKEADGLAAKGTWDLSTVIERQDLITQNKKSGIRIHLGQLM